MSVPVNELVADARKAGYADGYRQACLDCAAACDGWAAQCSAGSAARSAYLSAATTCRAIAARGAQGDGT